MSSSFWRRYLSDPFVVIASLFLLILAFCALFAPFVAPFEPDKQMIIKQFQMPNGTHWLGTDEYGRDTFSRIVYGGRLMVQSLSIAMTLAIVIGVPVGLISGYKGGRTDRLIMWVIDIFFSLPGVMVAFAIIAVLGSGLTNAMIAVGLVFSTRFARLTRGIVLAERKELYVDSARIGGLTTYSILFRHILPNILPPLIVQAALLAGAVILVEAALSYLGLGVNIGEPSWGLMLLEMQPHIRNYGFGVLPPGLAIVFTVLALNIVGDGLRDTLGRNVKHHSLGTVKPQARGIMTSHPHADGAVLSVRDLEVQFPANDQLLTILNGVSLEIMPGETLGLVGESGSGKSITALATLGLVPAPGRIVAGSIHYQGMELSTMRERDLNQIRGKEIAIIFQEPFASLNPTRTIGVQLKEKIVHHLSVSQTEAHEKAVQLLSLVKLPDAALQMEAYPHQLSGGMVQRISIAMALACEPKLLIADEPTTALDVTVQGQILDLLHEIQKKMGMAILLITHDMGVVAEICDRAAVMYAGEIVEVGDVEELFFRPKHPYTQALLNTMPQNNLNDGPLTIIEGVVPTAHEWPTGCRFHPRCQYATESCKTSTVSLEPQSQRHAVRCILLDEIHLAPTAEEVLEMTEMLTG